MSEREILIIYADGSVALNNNGGVGIRIISIGENGEEYIYDFSRTGYPNANSGQMEILACTAALDEADRLQFTMPIKKVIIFTDSKYVYENYKAAMFEWSIHKWLRKTGAPVPDAHLWKNLNAQIKKYNDASIYVEIKWVKGHGYNLHNQAVDNMAKKAAKLPQDKIAKLGPISIFQPRKTVHSRKLDLGSVKIQGQRISIKILSGKLLKPQTIWCYQYQVISKNNFFQGFVDQIFSTLSLDVNKTYYVKFNSLQENPRIEKLYWEIK